MVKKIKEMFTTAHSRNGAYSVGMTAVVIAIVIVLNMIVSQLPDNLRSIDVSDSKIYEITKTSREILKNLEKKVKLTVLSEETQADKRIRTFINKYANLSDEIEVEWVDPVLHPSVLSENDASADIVIVSCEETGKDTKIAFSDMIQYDMSSYYTTGQVTESGFDAEGQLTSAVNYVTNDTTKKLYRTSGHGEDAFGTNFTDLTDKSNLTITELNLVMTQKIPEDCDLLLMNGPVKDISEEEKTAISNYLQGGGNVMLFLGDTDEELPNLESLMKEYGLEAAEGYIADPSRCLQNNYYYIFPLLNASGDLTEGLSTEMILAANTHGMTTTDPARDTIEVTSILTTSNDAHAVTETSQEQGAYVIGAVAEETLSASDEKENDDAKSEGKQSRFTVFGSNSIIDSQLTGMFSTLDNMTFVMNAVTANFDDVQNVSIEAKSLGISYNTMQHADIFSLLVIFGIPLVILGFGMSIWMRRRKA